MKIGTFISFLFPPSTFKYHKSHSLFRYNLYVSYTSVYIYLVIIFMSVRYYHNITSNTLLVLETMAKHDVKTLIYSSTCATYGEPEKMPITEVTPQVPINPYGKAKKMAEDIILDFSRNSDMAVMILRFVFYIYMFLVFQIVYTSYRDICFQIPS